MISGSSTSNNQLFDDLYHELKIIAESQMRVQPEQHTLQPTALLNEAYLKLTHGHQSKEWTDKKHFLCTVAEAMRQILVDSARAKATTKRGGKLTKVEFHENELIVFGPHHDIISLHEALQKLESLSPKKAQLVKLRYFAGLTMTEIADLLSISPATAHNYWNYCKAWLHRELSASYSSR